MSDLTAKIQVPEEITLHEASGVLEIRYGGGQAYKIPIELMRVYSPSAEVRGHGPGQEVLQTGKRKVHITQLEPIGNYAVQPTFSDGHSTGIYSWEYLYFLATQQEKLWSDYEAKLRAAGVSRDDPMPLKSHSMMSHSNSCAG